MSKCSDCVHMKLCLHLRDNIFDRNHDPFDFSFDLLKESAEKICPFFVDESKFIYLPCTVGDKVYSVVHVSEAIPDFIHEDTITKIGITTKGILHERGIDLDDFGKTVFLTREEAEQALKEKP